VRLLRLFFILFLDNIQKIVMIRERYKPPAVCRHALRKSQKERESSVRRQRESPSFLPKREKKHNILFKHAGIKYIQSINISNKIFDTNISTTKYFGYLFTLVKLCKNAVYSNYKSDYLVHVDVKHARLKQSVLTPTY
jgi:hypothetical protein